MFDTGLGKSFATGAGAGYPIWQTIMAKFTFNNPSVCIFQVRPLLTSHRLASRLTSDCAEIAISGKVPAEAIIGSLDATTVGIHHRKTDKQTIADIPEAPRAGS